MSRHLLFILIIGISFNALAVSNGITKNEQIITYNDTVPHYYLDFENENIKFNWGTISRTKNLVQTKFYIRNNWDKDVTVLYTDTRNNNISFSGQKNRTVKPGGFYEVKCYFYVNHYPRNLHERIKINYAIGDSTKTYLVSTYGFYKPDTTNKYVVPLKLIPPPTQTYWRSNKRNYNYDITNKNNTFDWGVVKADDSTELVILRITNTTNDTLYIRSIDMAYDKVFVEGEINGKIIKNRTDVNLALVPNQDVLIRTKVLGIKEPIYSFRFPNFIDIIYFQNDTRKTFRLRNDANNSVEKEKPKIVKSQELKLNPPIRIENSIGKKYTQNYKSPNKQYYFNFSDANQSLDWGTVYVSPKIDSVVYLIKNTTGKKITVNKVELKNNFTNWSLSNEVTVSPNAYFEVKPHFYSINYTNENLSYPLIINYTLDKKQYEIIINTKVNGIHEPKTELKKQELKAYEKNRKLTVNNTVKFLKEGILEYSYEFANTNYGFDWGEFNPLLNNVVHFKLINNSSDTLFISQLNNPIINFKTQGRANNQVVSNSDYVNIKVLPFESIVITLNAVKTEHYTFKFPFYVRVKYFHNGERKVMRIINRGTFNKPEPIIASKVKKPDNNIVSKPILVQEFSLFLNLTSDSESIDDLVFIRWNGNKTETHYPKKNAVVLNVKDGELIYGMFYCEKYGVISKFMHTVNLKDKIEGSGKSITVYNLYENRDDYYYGSRNIAYIKQPYKIETKGYYKLNWITVTNDDRNQNNIDVKKYLKSLGYGPSNFLYESNLTKAISLEKTLKNSKYHIGMEPVIWYHPLTEQGWGGGYKVYANYFEIKFWSDASEAWIKALFNKYQITTYSKHNQIYIFQFKYIVSRSYMRILDKLWMKKEVLLIRQHKSGAADLD